MAERPINDYGFEQFLSEGKLMGARCNACETLYVPPRTLCPGCRQSEMEWTETAGEGRLVAFTSISIGTPAMIKEGYDRNNPYCSGAVELAEGARVVARIEGVDSLHPETIEVGMPLKVRFLHQGVGENRKTVLSFTPVGEKCVD